MSEMLREGDSRRKLDCKFAISSLSISEIAWSRVRTFGFAFVVRADAVVEMSVEVVVDGAEVPVVFQDILPSSVLCERPERQLFRNNRPFHEHVMGTFTGTPSEKFSVVKVTFGVIVALVRGVAVDVAVPTSVHLASILSVAGKVEMPATAPRANLVDFEVIRLVLGHDVISDSELDG